MQKHCPVFFFVVIEFLYGVILFSYKPVLHAAVFSPTMITYIWLVVHVIKELLV